MSTNTGSAPLLVNQHQSSAHSPTNSGSQQPTSSSTSSSSRHAPAPSLAISNSQVAQLQNPDLSEKLKTLKLEQQQQQQQQAAAAAASSSNAAAASSSSSSAGGVVKKKEMGPVRYAAERVIGNGSFGVVYQATIIETGETVAIKKVLQDPKFKNRELQIMGMMEHPDVISLKHCFYSKGEKPDEVFLNLVMDFVPETIHRTLRTYTKANKLLPIMYTKVYMYQISRSLSYIHSMGVCHRDIKPQNLLLNTKSHHVLLCDFGSAKVLVPGEPNVSYICSRYYRAPELVFEATQYSTSIDIWSLGCVMAEMLLGNPLFPGESAVDQLIEIIKIVGTPTRDEIHAMNPNHTSFKFPQIKPHPWVKVFRNKAPANAIDLVSRWLHYDPKARLDPFEALAHPFFDELREPNAKMPNQQPVPEKLFQWTENELKVMEKKGLTRKLIPAHLQHKYRHLPSLANAAAEPSASSSSAAQDIDPPSMAYSSLDPPSMMK